MIRRLARLPGLTRADRLSPEGIRQLQDQRLRKVVDHAYHHVSFYRQHFDAAGVTPEDVRSCDDLHLLPFTTRRQLRDAGPARTLTRGMDPAALIRRRTSGSSGEPFTCYFTSSEDGTRRIAGSWALRSIGRGLRDRMAVLGPAWRQAPSLFQRLGLLRRFQLDPLMYRTRFFGHTFTLRGMT